MFYILLILLGIPILEIFVFITFGSAIGAWPTIGFVILTAIIGSYLLKSQGLAVLKEISQKLDEGVPPAEKVVEALLVLIAGILLLTPGFVTDGVGFLMILPWSRQILGVTIVKIFLNRFGFKMAHFYSDRHSFRQTDRQAHNYRDNDDSIIDAEFHDAPTTKTLNNKQGDKRD